METMSPTTKVVLGIVFSLIFLSGVGVFWAIYASYNPGTINNQPIATTDCADDSSRCIPFDDISPSASSTGANPSGSGSPTSTQAAGANTPSAVLSQENSFAVTTKSAYSCKAQLPTDWTITSNKESNSADLMNSAKTMYAGYGITPVNTALASYAGYYQAPLNDPDLYSSDPGTATKAYAHIVASTILGDSSGLSFSTDTNETSGPYTIRSVAGGSTKGIVIFKTTGSPGPDGTSYIEPMYFALTKADLWDRYGLQVLKTALSINCTTQLVVHDNPVYSPSSASKNIDSDDTSDSGGYNVQLGTEYVHDANGTNYLVNPSTDWSETGPDGGGYYKSTSGGNDYEKLQAGYQ